MNESLPAVYAFGSFLATKIQKDGPDDKTLFRWARKTDTDLLSLDYVVVPTHYWLDEKKEKGHWVLVVRIYLTRTNK